MSSNFGDFQLGVYADAVKGVNSRYPFDFRSIERKASEALPDWVYRYVSAAAGDGRTQQANIDAYSHYGIIPRMMVSPPERDLSIDLFAKHFESPIFMCPIGLVGLCSPDFQGDVAAARASAATGVPFTLSTFSQARMEEVIKHAGTTPSFFQLYLPGDRELAASLISRAEASGYSALVVTVDSWTLGFRPTDLERGNFPQFRGFCMENYYSDENFTKHLAKPPREDQPAALAHYAKIFAYPMTWEDLRWIRSQTNLPIALKGIQHPDDARMAIDNGADVLYCTNHGGRQANSGISTLQLLPCVVKAAGSTPVVFDSGVRRCDRCRHRPGVGSNGRRDRPTLRLRPVLRRQRKFDALPEVLPRRIRSDVGHLRIQGHRRPQKGRLRTGTYLRPVIADRQASGREYR
jgi:lactate 2-monooxygenase